MKSNQILLFLCLFIAITACKDEEKKETMEPENTTTANSDAAGQERISSTTDSLMLALEENPELSTFAARMNAWEMDDTLSESKEPLTIFAPSNLAYSTMYREQGSEVLDVNTDAVLSYHMIPSSMSAEQIRQQVSQNNGKLALQTVNGELVHVGVENDTIVLTGGTGNKAKVTASYTSGNSVIHIINTVLLPKEIETEVIIETDSI